MLSAIINHHETIKEFTVATKTGDMCGQLEFSMDSVIVEGKGMVGYPVVINGIQEKEKDVGDRLKKWYVFVLLYVWGFVLVEQYRMRRKREKYGLVSGKTWNQFEIEDC